MTKSVLGIDLGTGSVKVSTVDKMGNILAQEATTYENAHPQPGYSEENPEDWVNGTISAIKRLIKDDGINPKDIEGASYSGQMHGLILLDKNNQVIRPAILWNDTRTTPQRKQIEKIMGDRFVKITGNKPLEGFTVTKLLWVKENEPENWKKVKTFMMPKDYLRFRMTGKIATDYSDATGTCLLNIHTGKWSREICDDLRIPMNILPPLIRSIDYVGNVTPTFANESGMSTTTKVFGGGADNACGAIGAGITSSDVAMVSIGTSGVVLHHENDLSHDYHGSLQMEDHAIPDSYYSMGVTLAAGDSLTWFKENFDNEQSWPAMFTDAGTAPIGSKGLLFAPYLIGERMPHADSQIRGSFIGVDRTQTKQDFTRAVMEGIIFSLNDILDIYRAKQVAIKKIIGIGGGAKNPVWLQMQADIFNLPVQTLKNPQGPGMGAAMIAAVGLDWFPDFKACADAFVQYGKTYVPIPKNAEKYRQFFKIYQEIYPNTKEMCHQLQQLK